MMVDDERLIGSARSLLLQLDAFWRYRDPIVAPRECERVTYSIAQEFSTRFRVQCSIQNASERLGGGEARVAASQQEVLGCCSLIHVLDLLL